MTLGHRVAVLHLGQLQQVGSPRELYDRPVNRFVAGFIGSPSMNLCEVALGANGSVSFCGHRVELAVPTDGRSAVVLGFRPESLELASEGIPAYVEVVEELGADAYVFCSAKLEEGAVDTRLVARTEARNSPARGDRVTLKVRPDEAHVFDPETGERLESD
jgi:multiple sugar transport system ATP-binding protein